ncbi:MAG TPA: PQQ-binding-like beta-propeller repeat protein [Rectinemataceae bacterium]|nr:PQQ-binding-like beta-propeller repeat protein [Rectinemataceae bacterium]
MAGPVMDGVLRPPAAWMLSEDGALYALTESGNLAARVALPDPAAAFLETDAFGRALVLLEGGHLAAYTRIGSRAWDFGLGTGTLWGLASGSDGRLFVAAGDRLSCLNPGGRPLWTAILPSQPSAPPAVDGRGGPCVGLSDGSLSFFDGYGNPLGRVALGSPARCLAPIPFEPVGALSPAGPPAAGVGAGPGQAPTPSSRALSPIPSRALSPTRSPILAAGCSDGRIRILGSGPTILAEAAVSGLPIAGLVSDGNLVYALDAGGAVFALDSAARLVWKTETSCRDGALALFRERLLVSGTGRAVSLSRGGEVFREISIANAIGRALPSPSGLLFSAGADWVLAAYRFERPLGPQLIAATAPYPMPDAIGTELLLYDPRVREGDRQLALLSDIEKSLGSASIGPEEGRAAAFCSAVALGQLEEVYPDAERRFRGNPLARAMACAILGELGSPAYRPALISVLRTDGDPAVRSVACDALGAIGVDPGGLTGQAFLDAASRPVDEGTAVSLIAAVERMALRSGTPPTIEAIRAVLKLANLPYGAFVRDRALAALGRMAGAASP